MQMRVYLVNQHIDYTEELIHSDDSTINYPIMRSRSVASLAHIIQLCVRRSRTRYAKIVTWKEEEAGEEESVMQIV